MYPWMLAWQSYLHDVCELRVCSLHILRAGVGVNPKEVFTAEQLHQVVPTDLHKQPSFMAGSSWPVCLTPM